MTRVPGKYGWVITWADPELFSAKEVGVKGPSGMTATVEEIMAQGREFRLYDDDGNLYYEGRVLVPDGADDLLFMPLDNWGTPNAGCTEIRLKQGEHWVRL